MWDSCTERLRGTVRREGPCSRGGHTYLDQSGDIGHRPEHSLDSASRASDRVSLAAWVRQGRASLPKVWGLYVQRAARETSSQPCPRERAPFQGHIYSAECPTQSEAPSACAASSGVLAGNHRRSLCKTSSRLRSKGPV